MKNCLKGCIVLKFYYLLKNGKIENCSQHLSFFSFFLLKWNCGKLGDKYGETFRSLNGTGTLYGDAVLEQVTECVLSNEVKESANQIQK